ncbi:hypothetical protein F2P81_011323 [Scophthalmus maximus]|uniref:Uncharacterized protein n=1 Tax=Scophthalmus maximus TaxID=52904 RepID=A0A6A4SYB1_SCOMX|nr:hypothetical protein F2P81_011323 [Scophthalmus maximus]
MRSVTRRKGWTIDLVRSRRARLECDVKGRDVLNCERPQRSDVNTQREGPSVDYCEGDLKRCLQQRKSGVKWRHALSVDSTGSGGSTDVSIIPIDQWAAELQPSEVYVESPGSSDDMTPRYKDRLYRDR